MNSKDTEVEKCAPQKIQHTLILRTSRTSTNPPNLPESADTIAMHDLVICTLICSGFTLYKQQLVLFHAVTLSLHLPEVALSGWHHTARYMARLFPCYGLPFAHDMCHGLAQLQRITKQIVEHSLPIFQSRGCTPLRICLFSRPCSPCPQYNTPLPHQMNTSAISAARAICCC